MGYILKGKMKGKKVTATNRSSILSGAQREVVIKKLFPSLIRINVNGS